MVEKKASDRLLDAAIDKLFDVVVTAIIGGASVAFGVLSGSFARVLDFATNHPFEAFLWSAAFLCAGIVAGLLIRHAISVAHLKRSISEKDAEIAKLRRNIIGLEDMDAIMRYLPDNLSRLVDEIHEEGGSVRCPHDSDLNELLSRRVLKCSSDGSELLTWSLAPGVVKYIKEKEREDG